MTTKELLYIQDALNHEKFLCDQCKELSGQISDTELSNFVKQLEKKHSSMFNQFYNLV